MTDVSLMDHPTFSLTSFCQLGTGPIMPHPLFLAQAVCNESFRRCTGDNVTVVTAFLDWDAAGAENKSSQENS